MPRTFALVFALVWATLACGDRPQGAPSDRPAADPQVVTPEGARVVAGDSAALPLPLLAASCVAGDAEQGDRWSLRGIVADTVARSPIEALAPRDSARFAARISRMVDVLPSDTSIADFRGLPVVVRMAWRLVPAEGDTVVIALVARRMPMESEPLEELFLIVAAPGQRQGVRDPLVETWIAREVGTEDALTVRDLLGALVDGDGLTLVFGHDDEDGVHTELLLRRAGRWSAGWMGVLPTCAP